MMDVNSTKQEMVRLDAVTKLYGSFTALHETDLSIRAGEFLTLLGPSGSGKTTLLNAVAGMTMPTSGHVWIDSQDVTAMPPEKRGLGMVFQSYALMPHMTVFDNIAYPLKVRKTPKQEIKKRVADVLELVRLPDLAHRKPKELSGGQQQRVSIARCLVYNPRLILMDEPLGALDKKLREQMQLEIKRLHNELGITMVYVTHDQEEALNMSDRIMLMNGGKAEQIGSPHDLYFKPVSQFAADFIGQSTMLDAKVLEAGDPCILDLGTSGQCKVKAPGANKNQSGKLVLRPETLRLITNDQLPDGFNALSVRYKDSLVTGGTTKYIVELENGTEMIVQELTTPEEAARRHEGRLFAAWPVEAGIFLDQ